MATGALGHGAISRQESFGTQTASWFFYPFVSESLVHGIDLLTVEGIRASLVEPDVVAGLERAEGDIVMEPHPLHIGHFLRGVFGQASSTALNSDTPMNDFTHTFNFRLTDFDLQKTPVPPYTLEFFRGAEQSFQFTDTVFSRIELNIEAGALMRATVGAMTRTVSLFVEPTPLFQEYTPWTWAVASASIAGVGVDFIEQLSFIAEVPIEGILALGSRRWFKFGRTGFPNIRVSGRIDLGNLDEYDQFVAQAERRLFINLTRTSNSGETMLIDVPSFRYEGFPVQVGGPGRITVDFTARGIFNVNSNQAATITLTNTQADYQ